MTIASPPTNTLYTLYTSYNVLAFSPCSSSTHSSAHNQLTPHQSTFRQPYLHLTWSHHSHIVLSSFTMIHSSHPSSAIPNNDRVNPIVSTHTISLLTLCSLSTLTKEIYIAYFLLSLIYSK